MKRSVISCRLSFQELTAVQNSSAHWSAATASRRLVVAASAPRRDQRERRDDQGGDERQATSCGFDPSTVGTRSPRARPRSREPLLDGHDRPARGFSKACPAGAALVRERELGRDARPGQRGVEQRPGSSPVPARGHEHDLAGAPLVRDRGRPHGVPERRSRASVENQRERSGRPRLPPSAPPRSPCAGAATSRTGGRRRPALPPSRRAAGVPRRPRAARPGGPSSRGRPRGAGRRARAHRRPRRSRRQTP